MIWNDFVISLLKLCVLDILLSREAMWTPHLMKLESTCIGNDYQQKFFDLMRREPQCICKDDMFKNLDGKACQCKTSNVGYGVRKATKRQNPYELVAAKHAKAIVIGDSDDETCANTIAADTMEVSRNLVQRYGISLWEGESDSSTCGSHGQCNH